MKTNTLIKFHQQQITRAINEAGRELPAMVISLILSNATSQVDKLVNDALRHEYVQEESERKSKEEAAAKENAKKENEEGEE